MTVQTAPIFQIENLRHIYGTLAAPLLDIQQLQISPGSITCFYGPNGSGKTTLFELLTLMRRPQQGRILFQQQEIFPGREGIAALRAHVTLVYQDPLLFDTSVERNVDYGLRMRGMAHSLRMQRVEEALDLVGLEGFQSRKARQLSGGERQRVALARALALHPSALLLDEFSANVDEKHRAQLETIIRQIRERFGTTILLTTHYLDQAYRVADNVLHLINGRLTASALTNLFRGVISQKDGHAHFSNGRIEFEVVTSHEGAATVSIPASSLVISPQPLASSMRNALFGKITHLIDAGNSVHLKVLAGETLDAALTKESYHELRLHPGMEVYLYFKATAVEVL